MCLRVLVALVAASFGLSAEANLEGTQQARLVVRADPRSGRLVRRVVVPEKVIRPVAVTPEQPSPKDRGRQAAGDRQLDGIVEQVSEEWGVDPLLVHAVIQVESGYNPYAISPKGAEGLMQLIPSTARLMGVRNSFDRQENVEGGVKYLKQLMERFSDLRHVLAAYNAGPEAVARWRGIPPYAETQNYVYKVGKRYGDLRRARKATVEQVALEGERPPEPQYRPVEAFIDDQGRLHLRTR